jgi:hypothetical protein
MGRALLARPPKRVWVLNNDIFRCNTKGRERKIMRCIMALYTSPKIYSNYETRYNIHLGEVVPPTFT